jgi:transposase
MARRSAVKAMTQAANQLNALVGTAPEGRKGGLAAKRLAGKASRFGCAAGSHDPAAATKLALRSVARRHLEPAEEIAEFQTQIGRLVREARPSPMGLDGVGPDTAATRLVVARDDPERLESESAFARLCGAAPVPASSGKVVRHRLNPRGSRKADSALHVVALNRMRRDPRNRAYVARRTARASPSGRSSAA